MTFERTLAPPNSILFVCDKDTGELPDLESMGLRLVNVSNSCVVVGTFAEPDGPTSIVFSDSPVESAALRGMKEVFDGPVEAPANVLHLCVVPLDAIATLRVGATLARVRIWANDGFQPDRLVIVVTSASTSASGESCGGSGANSPAACPNEEVDE